MLELESRLAGVSIRVNMPVHEVRRTSSFVVSAGGAEFQAPVLVVATGGLSIPKMGATAFGYDVARQFGLQLRECRPALVPLTFSSTDRESYCDLAGVSTEVIASRGKREFREKMLFTHRGLSGPAILQISSYWQKPDSIAIDLAPGRDVTAVLRYSTVPRNLIAARSAFRAILPIRLADRWLNRHAPGNWTNSALADLERQAHQWDIVPEGTEGYEKAEVTAGGVETGELSSKTMECRKVPGLYSLAKW